MKVEIIETGEQFEVYEPYILIKHKKLYNKNTQFYEGVKGDLIVVDDKEYQVGKWYTNYQLIPLEKDGIVLSAKDGRFKKVQHNYSVKQV